MPVLGTQVIKSIQRGNATMNPGNVTTVTITAVDLSKSFVSISSANGFKAGKPNNTSPSSDSVSYGASTVTGGSLTGTTSLYLVSGSGPGSSSVTSGNGVAYWEVIEYV
tara:strand:+ start:1300 stop:1626 length:327 start_codon:yes stop_codon:yes gene_type:complete